LSYTAYSVAACSWIPAEPMGQEEYIDVDSLQRFEYQLEQHSAVSQREAVGKVSLELLAPLGVGFRIASATCLARKVSEFGADQIWPPLALINAKRY